MAETLAAALGPAGNDHMIRMSKQEKRKLPGSQGRLCIVTRGPPSSQILITGEKESTNFLKPLSLGVYN